MRQVARNLTDAYAWFSTEPRRLRKTETQHTERCRLKPNHQGLGNALIERRVEIAHGRVACQERPGGVLK